MNKRRSGMNKIKQKENWFSTEKPTLEESERIKNTLKKDKERDDTKRKDKVLKNIE